MSSFTHAPGWPGIPPRWTSSAKSGVGTSPSGVGHVWFTLSHGIFNEIYYPDVDWACTRDMGLIVTDGEDFFSEEKRHATHDIEPLARGVPAYRLHNRCVHGRYEIEKLVLTSGRHDAVLQETRFVPLLGGLGDYHLYVLLAPHLGNRGHGNTAWVADYKGTPMLFARRGDNALALACSAPWRARSVGFVGMSDGWQDLERHRQLTWHYTRAENGNVALTGEMDLEACDGRFLLTLGFGRDASKAGYRALAALHEGFERSRAVYVHGWQTWQRTVARRTRDWPGNPELHRVSTAVLRAHESKSFASGIIASLSIPWGFAKGDNDLGGYHLVWPRDLVEAGGGLMAVGATADAHRVLRYLSVTQDADGRWPQNMWLDGTPYWGGIQMDETAFPILLVDLLRREEAITPQELAELWPMARRAAAYIARHGPGTEQDRWEENAGLSPFTLAVEIAALLVAAELGELHGEPEVARFLRELADEWNDEIERWTYATNTALARDLGIEGYYVRIAPLHEPQAASPQEGFVPIKLSEPAPSPAWHNGPEGRVVSPDALALVRFGLRASDDPRIVGTVKAIDALVEVDLPSGPGWRRYNGDRYGEHLDGSPYDGDGVGRVWPLLTGERAHYELAAGRTERAMELLRALEASANESGFFPEQIWDGPAVPRWELEPGRPTGSAMPLVWAHAEYLKLCRSLAESRVFDTPPQTVQRYVLQRTTSLYVGWRFSLKRHSMPAGKVLRVEVHEPALVHWSADEWVTATDTPTRDTGVGVHVAELPASSLASGSRLVFTFYWPECDHWEHVDYAVVIE
ncbi:MAG TPA: glycoside hydrolase family 15 protein [Gemmatimonadaceae bacterium]|nr:glycoside hydrolase family 15 protein [Gemmatimonadaceae bacterium]